MSFSLAILQHLKEDPLLQDVFRNAIERFELCSDTDGRHVEPY